MRVTQEIKPREAFIFVPFKTMMTLHKAQESPLSTLFDSHEELFTSHQDSEQLMLTVFLLYEFLKGEESYWANYISLLPDVQFYCHWPEEERNAIDCEALKKESSLYRQEIDSEWR